MCTCKFCDECESMQDHELCEACAEHLYQEELTRQTLMETLLYNDEYARRYS